VPLAAFEDAVYLTQTHTMDRGATLLIYSDGVTEAMDEKHTLFGDERISWCFADAPVTTAQDTVSRLISAVKHHEAGATQSDDITVVALRRV
jgi:sigma-B regulation protein RsbU (phosphoserine phosphatase)